MCCMRLSCLIIDHLLCVSVVCTNKQYSVCFFNCFYCSTYALVNCFNCFHCCRYHSCVSDHIRICKVDHDHIIFIGCNCLIKTFADFRSTHLRLQIISSNCRRFYQGTLFIFIWLFYTAVKEKCNMRIFLSLCKTKLFLAIRCKILAKCIYDIFFFKRDKLVGNCLIVILEAYKSKWHKSIGTLKMIKLLITKCMRHLASSIRTEIEKDH